MKTKVMPNACRTHIAAVGATKLRRPHSQLSPVHTCKSGMTIHHENMESSWASQVLSAPSEISNLSQMSLLKNLSHFAFLDFNPCMYEIIRYIGTVSEIFLFHDSRYPNFNNIWNHNISICFLENLMKFCHSNMDVSEEALLIR